ncbi:MAG: hypothetical protein H0U44_01830 [Flavisolibacter sp.]|jgi:hypothetical protein|nr:hypothetical protein [Flavisolibacter sp.]
MRKKNETDKNKQQKTSVKGAILKTGKQEKTEVRNSNAAGQGAMTRRGEELDKDSKENVSY